MSGKQATMYFMPDCQRCLVMRDKLLTAGYVVGQVDLRKVLSGEIPDVEALTELAMNNMAAPLVKIDGRFVKIEEMGIGDGSRE